MDARAGEHLLPGAGRAQPGQDVGGNDGGHEAEAHLRQANGRVVGGDGDVGDAEQPHAAPQRGAVDLADDHLRGLVDGRQHGVEVGRLGQLRLPSRGANGAHLADVAPGTKCAAAAG